MNDRINKLLRKIEWQGAADYSIGIKTCPCCRRRGNCSASSEWFEGHSDDCELQKMIEETHGSEI